MNIDAHLARRVRDLRKQHAFTLDGLAERSGVSRSMISLIEREETSPTAAVLSRLANALDVSLASLFAMHGDEAPRNQPLARLEEQQVWTDPDTGYIRRHVSSAHFPSPIELAEIVFPPGQSVTFERPASHMLTQQQIWMFEGQMLITVGDAQWTLKTGDCLAVTLDERIIFSNPTRKPARYAIALASTPHPQRNAQ